MYTFSLLSNAYTINTVLMYGFHLSKVGMSKVLYSNACTINNMPVFSYTQYSCMAFIYTVLMYGFHIHNTHLWLK